MCGVSTIISDKIAMKTLILFTSLLLVSSINLNAQIPNNGFEDWTNFGIYDDPNGWATMNSLSISSFHSCTKSTDHFPAAVGNYSLRLENNTSLTQTTGSYGLTVTDTMAYPFQPTFPIVGHPTSLCGYYKYLPQNGDSLWIKILLFDNGIMILDEQIVAIASSSWSSFTIPFSTYNSADSATIMMAAFYPNGPLDEPNGNSVLYVDNLSFDNPITGIFSLKADINNFVTYPNPANSFFYIDFKNENQANLKVTVSNTLGQIIKSEILQNNQQEIDISDFKGGTYFLEIKSEEWSQKQKLIIQK